MRLLADENLPLPLVVRLRAAGHDVAYAIEIAPETEDSRWLDYAWRDGRIAVTSDRDYGDLVFRHREPSRGVVFLRLEALPLEERILRVEAVWGQIESAALGRFITVTTDRVRVRDLPPMNKEEE